MAITGFVEFAGTSSVTGWAFDSESPSAHLEITVRRGEEFCASGFADVLRSDLRAAGIGDGKHGFSIDLRDINLSEEEARTLDVHAISGADVTRLSRVQDNSDGVIDLVSDATIPTSDPSQFPVFILGPARSGTSAVTLALLESAAYIGSGEGHLMPLLHPLLAVVDQHYRRVGGDPHTMLGRVSISAFQKLIRRSFIQLARDLFPTPRWLDKTPSVEMVRAAPLMRELWPNARFIFMKRRVIENVLSRQRKFPQDSVDRHYSDWIAVMKAWIDVRDSLGDAYLEVEHRQLVVSPEETASTISDFLDLSDEPRERFIRYVTDARPEQTDQNFGATYAMGDLNLSKTDAKQMMAACDEVMSALGYSYDKAYFATD